MFEGKKETDFLKISVNNKVLFIYLLVCLKTYTKENPFVLPHFTK